MDIINPMRCSGYTCGSRGVDYVVARTSAKAGAAGAAAAVATTKAAIKQSYCSSIQRSAVTSHRRRPCCSSVSASNVSRTTVTAMLLLSHCIVGSYASFLSFEQYNKHPWCARSKVAADEVHVQSSFKVNATLPVFTSLFSRDILTSIPFASPSCASSTRCRWWLDRYSEIPALVLLNASDFNVSNHEHTRALLMLLRQSHVIALATSSMSFPAAPPVLSPVPVSSRRGHHRTDEEEEDGALHTVKRELSVFETITGFILPFYTVSDVDIDVDINLINTTTTSASSNTGTDSIHDDVSAISASAIARLHGLGLSLPLFRLQLSLRRNNSFDALFDDDALRYVRSAMEHHDHDNHDHSRRGPRKLLSVLDFLTHAQLICLLWRLQCHAVSPCDAVFRLCVTVVRRVPFDMLDTNELRHFVPLSKYKYEYEYENDTQRHRSDGDDDISISSSRGKDKQEGQSCFDGQRETIARAVSLARQGDVSEQDIRALLFHPYDNNINGDIGRAHDSKGAMAAVGGWPQKGGNRISMAVVAWAPVGCRVLSVVLLCCAVADMVTKKDRNWARRLLGTRLSDRMARMFEHRAKLF